MAVVFTGTQAMAIRTTHFRRLAVVACCCVPLALAGCFFVPDEIKQLDNAVESGDQASDPAAFAVTPDLQKQADIVEAHRKRAAEPGNNRVVLHGKPDSSNR